MSIFKLEYYFHFYNNFFILLKNIININLAFLYIFVCIYNNALTNIYFMF